eukprot:3136842-Pyramimonas_sp.AAC.1
MGSRGRGGPGARATRRPLGRFHRAGGAKRRMTASADLGDPRASGTRVRPHKFELGVLSLPLPATRG